MTNIQPIDFARPQKYSVAQNENSKYSNKKHLKSVAFLSSAAGTAAILTLLAKKQGFSVSPKTIAKTPIKDWIIFKIANKNQPDRKLLKIEEKEIFYLASGSVVSGLIGGSLYDKDNFNAKLREGITQIAGNVLVPVAFVGGASRIYKKHESKIKSIMPQFKNPDAKKFIGSTNKFIKNIPAVLVTAVALGFGIVTGNKVTNFINEQFFGQKRERKIKTTDFAPHVDDLCLAVTLMGSKNSPLATSITRTVPAFLTVPGYQVAKAQEQ